MSRPNIAIVTFSALLVVLFVAAVTSRNWVPFFAQPDRGIGVVVVAVFISAHIALTVCLAWATITAVAQWRRNLGRRTKIDQAILVLGIIAASVATIYAAYFVWG